MKVQDFRADADLVGRRIRVRWRFLPDKPDQALGALPPATLRRKTRDFEFPAPGPGDPFSVYDSATFPPAGAQVRLLPARERYFPSGKDVVQTESVVSGAQEVLRRTVTTRFNTDGQPLAAEVEILDASPALEPAVSYYYVMTAATATSVGPNRASVAATERYGLGRKMYDMLPEIYRRHDVRRVQGVPETGGIPEASDGSGQLRRFVDLFGYGLDFLRSRAEGLRGLQDIETVEARHLPLLARWIGWDLSFAGTIPEQRHEIRYAPALYRLTGTIPGCRIWVRRLTGWDSKIKEFGRNVFFSNDLGNPDDPTDHGSRTVDTENAALLATIKTFDDDLDYTYDTGTDDNSWYAYNAIGIFLQPPAKATADEIARMRARLRQNFDLFLPTNLRGVVVLDVPQSLDKSSGSLGLLNTEEN